MSLNEALCREMAALLSSVPASVPSKPQSPLDKLGNTSKDKKTPSIFATTWSLLNSNERPSSRELVGSDSSSFSGKVLEENQPHPALNDNGDNVDDVNHQSSTYSLNLLRLLSSDQVVTLDRDRTMPDISDAYSTAGPPSHTDSAQGIDLNQNLNLDENCNSVRMRTSCRFLHGKFQPKTDGGADPTSSGVNSACSSRIFIRDSRSLQRKSSTGINAILQDASNTSVGSTHRSSLRGPRCAYDYCDLVANAEASKMVDDFPSSHFPYEHYHGREEMEVKPVESHTPILKERTPETISKSFLQSVNEQIQNIKMSQARDRNKILSRGRSPAPAPIPVHQPPSLVQFQNSSFVNILGDAEEIPSSTTTTTTIAATTSNPTPGQGQGQHQQLVPQTYRKFPENTSIGTCKHTIIIDRNIRNKIKAESSIQTETGSASSPLCWGQRSSMDSQMTILAQCERKLLGCRSICYPLDPDASVDDSRDMLKRRLLSRRRSNSFFGRYLNFNDALGITSYSLQAAWNTADEIFRSYIIPPELEESSEATREEMEEAEDMMSVAVMRLLGLPQDTRFAVYKEVLQEIQVVQDFSVGTIQLMTSLIDWICTGNHDGAEDLVAKTRLLATSQTELNPESEAWRQFERDICVFSQAVASTALEAARAVSRQCRKSSESLSISFGSTRLNEVGMEEVDDQGPPSNTSIESNVIPGPVTESEFEFRPVTALEQSESQGSQSTTSLPRRKKSRIPIPISNTSLKPEEAIERDINFGMLRDAIRNEEKKSKGHDLTSEDFSEISTPNGNEKSGESTRGHSSKPDSPRTADESENDSMCGSNSPSAGEITLNHDDDGENPPGTPGQSQGQGPDAIREFDEQCMSRFLYSGDVSSVASALLSRAQSAASYIPSFDDTFGPQIDDQSPYLEDNTGRAGQADREVDNESFLNSFQRAVETASSMIFGGNPLDYPMPRRRVRSNNPSVGHTPGGSLIKLSHQPVPSRRCNSNTGSQQPFALSDLSNLPGHRTCLAKFAEQNRPRQNEDDSVNGNDLECDAERPLTTEDNNNLTSDPTQDGESVTVRLSKACLNNLYQSLKDSIPSPLITLHHDETKGSAPSQVDQFGHRGQHQSFHSISNLNLSFPKTSDDGRVVKTTSGHSYVLNSRRSSSTTSRMTQGITSVPSVTSHMLVKVPRNSHVGLTLEEADRRMREDIAYLEEILKTLKETSNSESVQNQTAAAGPRPQISTSSFKTPGNPTHNNNRHNVHHSRIPTKKPTKLPGKGGAHANVSAGGAGQTKASTMSVGAPQRAPNNNPGSNQPQSQSTPKLRVDLNPSPALPYSTNHRAPRIVHPPRTPTSNGSNRVTPIKPKLQIINAVPVPRPPYQVSVNRQYGKQHPESQHASRPRSGHGQSRSMSRGGSGYGQGQGQGSNGGGGTGTNGGYQQIMQNKHQSPVPHAGRSRTIGRPSTYSRPHSQGQGQGQTQVQNQSQGQPHQVSGPVAGGQRSGQGSKTSVYKYDDGTHEQKSGSSAGSSMVNSSKCSSAGSSCHNTSMANNGNNNTNYFYSNNYGGAVVKGKNESDVQHHSRQNSGRGGLATPIKGPEVKGRDSGPGSGRASGQPSLFFPSLEPGVTGLSPISGLINPFARLSRGVNKVIDQIVPGTKRSTSREKHP